ncbi:hypothetical protein [Streptomyces sp. 7N604]|uniref:hypothetical protein n=1 Tax=Streptomyces sp. 7N604 TaxID=3457415 RepID=UPI003FD34255
MTDTRFENELLRLTAAPPAMGSAVHSLGVFEVEVEGSLDQYASRVREALAGAVGIAKNYSFDVDELPSEPLPHWLVQISSQRDKHAPESGSNSFSERGAQQYESMRGEDRWDLQEWISCFDPQLRYWSWWDITRSTDTSVKIWIDTRGEAVVGCEELRWIIFVAGACSLSEMELTKGSAWSPEASLGWGTADA